MSEQTTITPERVAKIAAKIVTETAYALAGLADVVAGTVQDVIKTHKEDSCDCPGASATRTVRDYVNAVPGHVKSFVDEAVEAYQELAARGRVVVKEGFSSTAHRTATTDTGAAAEEAPVSDTPAEPVHEADAQLDTSSGTEEPPAN